jgi:hypothetical protein
MVCGVVNFITGIVMGMVKQIEDKNTFLGLSIGARVLQGHADYSYIIIATSFILNIYKHDPN